MSFVSYAQNFEDVILWRALGNVKDGFYVDVGANDPVRESVTLAFYEKGWRGVNIEPSFEAFARLAAQRERDINIHAFASDKAGLAPFFEFETPGLSTGYAEIAARHRQAGHVARECSVPSVTLNEILESHRVSDIHFLKIDAEGAEAQVLRGLDLHKFRPWVLLVEATIPNTPTPTQATFDPLLAGADYLFCYFDGLNRFYVPKERFDALAPLIAVPPNFFDGFVRASEVELRAELDRERQKTQDAQGERETLEAKISAVQRQLEAVAVLQSRLHAASTNAQRASDHSAKVAEALMQALRKQFGERRPIRLDEPEPRYGPVNSLIKRLRRNQGSLNKYLIGAMRHQLDWNKNEEARLRAVEQVIQTLCAQLRQGAHAAAESLPPQDLARMTSSGRRIFDILLSAARSGERP